MTLYKGSDTTDSQYMSAHAWMQLEALARREGLDEANIAALALGCPRHGNAHMDFDDDGAFCYRCDRGE